MFTAQRRANHQFLKMLIDEGDNNIRIFLEEMDELKTIDFRIESWLDNVMAYIEQPPID